MVNIDPTDPSARSNNGPQTIDRRETDLESDFREMLLAHGLDPSESYTFELPGTGKTYRWDPAQENTLTETTPTIEYEDTKLAWLIDSFGPKGADVLTPNGIQKIARFSEMIEQYEDRQLDQEHPSQWVDEYQKLYNDLTSGFLAVSGMEGMIAALSLEEFDPEVGWVIRDSTNKGIRDLDPRDGRDANLINALRSYLDDWVKTGLGDPALLTMSTKEQLEKMKNLESGFLEATELLFPEQVLDDSGATRTRKVELNLQISSFFPKIDVAKITRDDGKTVLFELPYPDRPTPDFGR